MAIQPPVPLPDTHRSSGRCPWPEDAEECNILSQASFVRMIRVERKRTERSGKPFLLALASSEDLRFGLAGGGARQIAKAISSSTRETDWIGWYEEGTTLGVLYTEIGSAEAGIVRAITEKILAALRCSLDEEQLRRVHLVCRIFPQDSINEINNPDSVMFYPDLPERGQAGGGMRFLKRTIDVAGSLLALFILSPLLVCLAAAIKATSRGPVLFCQQRVGMYGRTFCFWKLRSMYIDNDSRIHQDYVARLIAGDSGLQHPGGQGMAYKLTKDPRVTPVGRLLRKTSLDELPQFFNVLMGDMSLVGPRPPVLYEYERYQTWHKGRAVEIKPGLTGLWQVEGRSKTTFDEMVRMDLKYLRQWSFWLDLKILLQTPAAVLSGDGAY